MEKILILARPTDPDFYKRWWEIGAVVMPGDPCDDVSILVTDQHAPVSGEDIQLFPKLKYVCSANTGHTHLRFDPDKYGIKLITLKGESEFLSTITSVAEFTFHLILSMTRDVPNVGIRLSGKTIGIVGCGRIGTQVHKIAKGFGMNLLEVDKGSKKSSWTLLFKESDFVSIHLNEEEKNNKIIGRELLSLMKPTSYFINTARGSLVDEECLAGMLETDKIAGAAVDVVDGPYLTAHTRNLLMTPHIAGNTLEDRIATDVFIVEKTKKLLRGSRLLHNMKQLSVN